MANTITLKRSVTAGAVPTSLALGEVAINLADKLLYSMDNSGNIVQIAGSPVDKEETLSNKTLTAPVVNNQKMTTAREGTTVSATAATGTINYDVLSQSVLYYTSNATGNFVINLRGSSSATLGSTLATGEAVTISFLVTNGATAYVNSSVSIDGTTATVKWIGGQAPIAGNPSSIDMYTLTVIKTGTGTYTTLGSFSRFA